MTVANWDDLAAFPLQCGHIDSLWRDLGRAARSRTVGVRRIEVAPDSFATPVHVHGVSEEIFYVLGGSGLSWQDGRTYEIGPGDCIVHRAGRETHTLRGGPDGLDVLAYGLRAERGGARLPRAGITWVGAAAWVELGGDPSPFEREAAAGPPQCPPPEPQRPRNIVNAADAPATHGGANRHLGQAAGASATGLNLVTLQPGQEGAPLHCHSAEEEIFIVLEGEGELVLDPGEPEPLRAGSIVSRHAGTGIAHTLRAGAASGITYLAYGTREPNDMTYYPQSGRVSLRGLGVFIEGAQRR